MKRIKYILPLLLLLFICGCEKKNEKDVEIVPDENNKLVNDAEYFLYVGNSGKKNSIFKYDFQKENSTLVWFSEKESVVNLSYSPDKKFAFFITATSHGKRGVFPFIRFVRVYHYDCSNGKIVKVKNLKHGVQLFSMWNYNQLFEITLNSIDSTIANYIIQTKTIFTAEGKEIEGAKKIFDLLTDGYPPPPKQSFNISSPNGKYFFEVNEESEVRVRKNGERWQTLRTIDKPISDVGWSSNDRYLIFSTLDVSPNNETLDSDSAKTSEIFVYDLQGNNIVHQNSGSGLRNFLLFGNIIIYDKKFSEKAEIVIYDLNLKTEKKIEQRNGCGIKNIAEVPDYDA